MSDEPPIPNARAVTAEVMEEIASPGDRAYYFDFILGVLEAWQMQWEAREEAHAAELQEAVDLLRAVVVVCPNCDEDRRVECSDECVQIAPNIDKARAWLARYDARTPGGDR